MTGRRLAGQVVGAGFGVTALLALLTACADDGPQGVEVCARPEPSRVVRVDDAECDQNRPGVGRYVMRLPSDRLDPDGNTIYTPLIVPNVGAPIPAYGSDPAYVFVPARPDPARPGQTAGVGRTARVPAVAGPSGSTISRGGLGVSGRSSAGG